MSNYTEFLKKKNFISVNSGFNIDDSLFNKKLFPFQLAIVKWALKIGKACIFADTGLGKTFMMLEWSKHVTEKTDGNVLIICPLAVAKQTQSEGIKFGINSTVCRTSKDVKKGINITNYEMLDHFDLSMFDGIVLDESSILKNYSGVTRNQLINDCRKIPYKLACTATPAPNDYMELGNHSEFVNNLTRTEMLSMFFVHDGGETQKWRLKGHAEEEYWKWISSWAVMIKLPSDIGFEDNGYILPSLNIKEHIIDTEVIADGFLFPMNALTLSERREARKLSINDRVSFAANIANNTSDPVLIWCDLNSESEMLKNAINGAVEIKGSDSNEHKESSMVGFTENRIKKLVTKPSIAGHGMNWQHCNTMIFVGLSDSFEAFYQAVRRCWRFGQTKTVNVHVIISKLEGNVLDNIHRKQTQAETIQKNMISHMEKSMKENLLHTKDNNISTNTYKFESELFTIYNGDCVEVLRSLPDNSIHYSIFSPPFADLYTYSNDIRDMGNNKNYDEFFEHFDYLVKELFRIVKPGRLISFHCMDLPLLKEKDGVIGLRDFSGDLLQCFTSNDFIYHGKHVIWKDPLIEATRTKSLGLMHKQIMKDSSMCRSGLPDYLITVRKPGINDEPISHPEGFTDFVGENEPKQKGIEYSHNVWRRYASPVWMDINQTRTLQKESAREEKDEKHICPLQLDVIDRGLSLYSNKNDIVLSPFAGIGSEGFEAISLGRRFIGVELKKSYFDQMANNLQNVLVIKNQGTLFENENSSH
jgi:DNA modification methylase